MTSRIASVIRKSSICDLHCLKVNWNSGELDVHQSAKRELTCETPIGVTTKFSADENGHIDMHRLTILC